MRPSAPSPRARAAQLPPASPCRRARSDDCPCSGRCRRRGPTSRPAGGSADRWRCARPRRSTRSGRMATAGSRCQSAISERWTIAVGVGDVDVEPVDADGFDRPGCAPACGWAVKRFVTPVARSPRARASSAGPRRVRMSVAADPPDDVGEAAEPSAEIFAIRAPAGRTGRDDLVVPAVERGPRSPGSADPGSRDRPAQGSRRSRAPRRRRARARRRRNRLRSGVLRSPGRERLAAGQVARRVAREEMLDQVDEDGVEPLSARRSSR